MNAQKNQRDKILVLLKQYRNEWVPLYSILALGVAQYNARIYELRGEGHVIENKTAHVNGEVHSWFRIVIEHGQREMFK